MNFMEAIKLMKEGKKVRNLCFKEVYYWIDGDMIMGMNTQGEAKELWLNDFEATDWELYQEIPKTLTEEINELFDKHMSPITRVEIFEILRHHNKRIKEEIDKMLIDNSSYPIDDGRVHTEEYLLKLKNIIDKNIGEL